MTAQTCPKPLRIVIADDESDIRQYFRRLLPRFGHEVVGEAETGLMLVELCQSERPDLIITDIRMPEMDGIEAAHQISRSHPIPVIVVSSHEVPNYDGEANIVAFLVKPIVMPELRAAIDRAIPTR
jgi:two-component system, response regulator PdtaR